MSDDLDGEWWHPRKVGKKYADTWDHLGDAREQFEALANDWFKLRAAIRESKDGPDDLMVRLHKLWKVLGDE